VVVVAELLVEVVDDGRVPPPGDRHEEVVEKTDDGDDAGDSEQRPRNRHELLAAKHQRAAEEVRTDRDEIVLEREPDRRMVGRAVERRLRQHRVHADEHAERGGEHVDRPNLEREPPRTDRIDEHARKRDSEQDLLPGLEGGQSAPTHAGAVQGRHHRVVGGEADQPRVQRRDRPSPDEERCGNEQKPVQREREPRSHQARVNRARTRVRPRLVAERLDLATPRQHGFSLLPPSVRRTRLMLP